MNPQTVPKANYTVSILDSSPPLWLITDDWVVPVRSLCIDPKSGCRVLEPTKIAELPVNTSVDRNNTLMKPRELGYRTQQKS